eukprot:2695301-Pleurochrysis_carterae.AAC.1
MTYVSVHVRACQVKVVASEASSSVERSGDCEVVDGQGDIWVRCDKADAPAPFYLTVAKGVKLPLALMHTQARPALEDQRQLQSSFKQ